MDRPSSLAKPRYSSASPNPQPATGCRPPRHESEELDEEYRAPALGLIALLSTGAALAETHAELAAQVRAAETAFAKTMADRDHAAFSTFLADEAIFFGQGALLGKAAIAAGWKPFYEGPTAPFSWEPTTVEVLDSGTLALSSGPVRDPQGKQIGTFSSIWRREADGKWRVVFDKGSPCDTGGAP